VGLGRNAITQLTTVTIDEETAYYTSPVLRVGLFSEAYRFYLILWLDRISGVGTPQLRVPPGLVDRSWTFPNIHFLFLSHDNEGCFRRVHISTAAYQGGVNRDAKGYLSFPCVSGWVDNWGSLGLVGFVSCFQALDVMESLFWVLDNGLQFRNGVCD